MQLSTTAGFLDLIPPLVVMGIGMPFMFRAVVHGLPHLRGPLP